MARSIHRYTGSALVLTALLAAASLFRPATAQAQSFSSERALMNRIAAPVFDHAPEQRAGRSTTTGIEGERALLGRTNVVPQPTLAFASAPIDGERALLGRWPHQPRIGFDLARGGSGERSERR
jgi:hypothetical protein